MINLKQELAAYPPIDIKSLTDKDPSIPDNIINSILLYNKALDNLRMNSEDIAVIELKKAIAMNPDFHEAMNLLGICYIYTKDHTKAQEIFQRVAVQENNGAKALHYMNLIKGGSSVLPPAENKSKAQPQTRAKRSDNSPGTERKKSPAFDIDLSKLEKYFQGSIPKYIGFFAAGVVLALLINLIFFSSPKDIKISNGIEDKPDAVLAAENANKEKLEELGREVEKLQTELKTANTEVDYYKNVSRLLEVENLYTARNNEGAADLLMLLKPVQFKDPEKSKFDSLYGNVIPRAAWSVFNEGNALMGQKKYQEAINKLNKVQIYGTDWAYMDITLYNTGLCYKELQDSRNALDVFQQLIAKYPKSQFARYAKFRMDEIKGVP